MCISWIIKCLIPYVNLHNNNNHISVTQLGHLLTRSGLTYPEVSSKVYPDSFCQSDSSVSLPWVIYFEAFYLHVVSSFSCIPVICPKVGVICNVNLHRLTKHTHIQSSHGDGNNDSKISDLLEIPRTVPV